MKLLLGLIVLMTFSVTANAQLDSSYEEDDTYYYVNGVVNFDCGDGTNVTCRGDNCRGSDADCDRDGCSGGYCNCTNNVDYNIGAKTFWSWLTGIEAGESDSCD